MYVPVELSCLKDMSTWLQSLQCAVYAS